MNKFDTVVAADGSKRVFNSEDEFIAYRQNWGIGIVSSPEYKAEQERRNAEMRAALDDIGIPEEMIRQARERQALRADMEKAYGYDPLNPPQEKPVDIMAETRRMLG